MQHTTACFKQSSFAFFYIDNKRAARGKKIEEEGEKKPQQLSRLKTGVKSGSRHYHHSQSKVFLVCL